MVMRKDVRRAGVDCTELSWYAGNNFYQLTMIPISG